MRVREIVHFDKKGREAEVVVSDGAYEVLCYAFPIDTVRIGMAVSGLSGVLMREYSQGGSAALRRIKAAALFCLSDDRNGSVEAGENGLRRRAENQPGRVHPKRHIRRRICLL